MKITAFVTAAALALAPMVASAQPSNQSTGPFGTQGGYLSRTAIANVPTVPPEALGLGLLALLGGSLFALIPDGDKATPASGTPATTTSPPPS